MKYCILTAPLETRTEPTYSLRKPFKQHTYYTEDPEIFEFNTEAEAIEFAQGYLPFDKVMALPGTRRALEFYANVWAYKGNRCAQDLPNLAEKLADPENWYWSYCEDDVEKLDASSGDLSDIKTERTDDDEEGFKVGSYAMGESRLTGKQVGFSMLCDLPDFEELTEEEQNEVICPSSFNKKKVVVEMGWLFDVYCKRKAGRLAKLYAYWLLYGDDIRMFNYRVKRQIQAAYNKRVYKFNSWRLERKNGS